ncbi:MAG TPA: AbrB/MazE/SpoVT family DNA-binding domain-containing protein [Nanoarchaeota archaeon]|nr:AbrB/MazE/SpoVT family DNA-binding domain-containing protein [Nanoarchaeota archaeon]
MANEIDIGTVSARGQVAIPIDIRDKMGLKEGEKVLFVLEGDMLLIKKISELHWSEITKPLRGARKKITEDAVTDLVHKIKRSLKKL